MSDVLRSHQELPEERKAEGQVSTLPSTFIQRSLLLSVSFVYAFTSVMFEQRVSSVNILIYVWENNSTSYFALSFSHRPLEALE